MGTRGGADSARARGVRPGPPAARPHGPVPPPVVRWARSSAAHPHLHGTLTAALDTSARDAQALLRLLRCTSSKMALKRDPIPNSNTAPDKTYCRSASASATCQGHEAQRGPCPRLEQSNVAALSPTLNACVSQAPTQMLHRHIRPVPSGTQWKRGGGGGGVLHPKSFYQNGPNQCLLLEISFFPTVKSGPRGMKRQMHGYRIPPRHRHMVIADKLECCLSFAIWLLNVSKAGWVGSMVAS